MRRHSHCCPHPEIHQQTPLCSEKLERGTKPKRLINILAMVVHVKSARMFGGLHSIEGKDVPKIN